jgi:hypothetical protein
MAEAKRALDPQDDLARLLAIQIKLTVGGQGDAISELSRVGIPNVRIGELLGTATDTVKVTVQRDKKSAAKPKRAAKRKEGDPDG